MHNKYLLPLGLLCLSSALGSAQVLTVDLDSMTAGAIDETALDAATTGGDWVLNTDRGSAFTIEDSSGDKALLIDDTNGGNAGDILFATLTLDTPVDIGVEDLTWTTKTATRRTGSNKGLSFRFLSGTTQAAQLDWWHSGDANLAGGDTGSVPFQFTAAWDPAHIGVHDLVVTFDGADVTVEFNDQTLLGTVAGGVSTIDTLEVWSLGSENNGPKGLFLDDLTVTTTASTDPPTINSFTVNPASILEDREVTLSWDTLGATDVSIAPDVGAVAVDGSTATAVTVGSLPITFTLTATNANGNATADITVTARPGVTQPPTIMACWPFDGDLTETIVGWTATEVDGGDTIDDVDFAADVPAALSGRRTQSLHFSSANVDDYILTDFAGVAGITPRSVSCWVKTNDLDSACLFSYGLDNNGRAFVNYIDAAGEHHCGFRGAGEAITTDSAVPLGTWTHLAVVYAGVSGDIYENTTIYIDGTRYNQLGFFNGTPISTVPTYLEFGRDVTRKPNDPKILQDVMISEWTFFRGELTAAQVAALAGGGDPKMLDGSATPTISAVPFSYAPSGNVTPASTNFEITYSATEGSIWELWSSTDLQTDWTLRNGTVMGAGGPATLTPAIDPSTKPKEFFQLRQK